MTGGGGKGTRWEGMGADRGGVGGTGWGRVGWRVGEMRKDRFGGSGRAMPERGRWGYKGREGGKVERGDGTWWKGGGREGGGRSRECGWGGGGGGGLGGGGGILIRVFLPLPSWLWYVRAEEEGGSLGVSA